MHSSVVHYLVCVYVGGGGGMCGMCGMGVCGGEVCVVCGCGGMGVYVSVCVSVCDYHCRLRNETKVFFITS